MVKGMRLWGFVALCVLSGSGWLLEQSWPSQMQWPFGSCLHFGVIGLLGLVISTLQGGWRGFFWRKAVAVALAGMSLFALPSAVLQIAAGKVPEYTSAAVFCAVPLMTIFVSSAFGHGEGSRLRGLMVPSMIGLAGALLLFPVQGPGSLRRWLFFALVLGCCVVVAVASVWMHQLMQGAGVAASVAVIGLGSAAVLGSYGASLGWPTISLKLAAGESLRRMVFDLLIVWLLVWLAREVAPARLAARFLLMPLLTVVEGYTLEGGPVDARAILAVVLIAVGGAMLLFKDDDKEPGTLFQ